ncbi:gamma-butyrobetaine hydroxylase-like domain-containing protein [Hahella ganghwensis]|uniref:gamma-butyrobetaine hydroxylase-like domain-containing protein n=1 Tax=Hahella ganghwensis TaxID=286420 RepID=UPI000364DE94|nr:DUF971 domain-containing protein [Hahella ganghwensis]
MSNIPSQIQLHQKSCTLELTYASGLHEILDAEFLRVNSPSAEVRGHGGQGGTLPTGKRDVAITNVEVVGNYALKITFSDGHDSGLYAWDYLEDLCRNKSQYWQSYLAKLSATNGSRD